MMFKHQIDAQIKRLRHDRRKMQQFGNIEQAMYIQKKIDSWYKVRIHAPEAKIGASW